ncbi:MAG: anti-sigma factor antagonist [Spirochaetes bacterium]|nr:MAG: anti-sigma factor antagonist [Spirochaetota bacterium]
MDNTHKVSFEYIEDIPVMVIEGDMTSEADSDVMKTYQKIKEKNAPKSVVINFEKTNYINSAGIATLINIIQDIGEIGGKISIAGLSTHFQKVMDIVGISDFVDIYNTDYDAIREIKTAK